MHKHTPTHARYRKESLRSIKRTKTSNNDDDENGKKTAQEYGWRVLTWATGKVSSPR